MSELFAAPALLAAVLLALAAHQLRIRARRADADMAAFQ
jgi:hypothetical protein